MKRTYASPNFDPYRDISEDGLERVGCSPTVYSDKVPITISYQWDVVKCSVVFEEKKIQAQRKSTY